MTAIVSDKLAAYLAKKERRLIVVDLASCKTCGGAVSEVFARLAKNSEIEELGASARRLPCLDERGEKLLVNGREVEAVIANRFVKIGDDVRFDLRRFLGAADIAIEGITF